MKINWRRDVSLNTVGWTLLLTAWVFLGAGLMEHSCEANENMCATAGLISVGTIVFSVIHRKPGWGAVTALGIFTFLLCPTLMH